MPYFDNDGNELNPNLVAKPALCVACVSDDAEHEMGRVRCDLTRLDQQDEAAFTCHAYTPKFPSGALDDE